MLFSNCRSTKPLSSITVDRSEKEILEALESHNYDFQWFSGEASIHVDSPQETFKGKTYIRMRKDSVIWSIVKKSSVEGGRLLFTPEMYAVINRLDGTFTRGQSAEMLTNVGLSLDFKDIQQAVFGNVILPSDTTYEITKQDTQHYLLTISSAELNIDYTLEANSMFLTSIKIKESSGKIITVKLADYESIDGKTNFAKNRTYTIMDPLQGQTTIALNYKKVEIDVPKQLKFTIPPHYEEIR